MKKAKSANKDMAALFDLSGVQLKAVSGGQKTTAASFEHGECIDDFFGTTPVGPGGQGVGTVPHGYEADVI